MVEQIKDVHAFGGNSFDASDVTGAARDDFVIIRNEENFFTGKLEVVDDVDDFFRLRSCQGDFVQYEQFIRIYFIAQSGFNSKTSCFIF